MNRLDRDERYQIFAMLAAGFTKKAIADKLGRSPSTICREIKRNSGAKTYNPEKAHGKAVLRAKTKPKHSKLTSKITSKIDEKIRLRWSPEQISGYYKSNGENMVSHETIYQHIWLDKLYGGNLYTYLRRSGKRKKTYGKRDLRGHIKNRVSIDERPSIVNENIEFGHWEIDLVVGSGHKGFLVTAVERISKNTLIGYSLKKDASSVSKELIAMLKPIKDSVKTITADNGKEFAEHEKVAKALNAGYYFAHPYRSCERGLNENTNGLIRQYFPKGADLRNLNKKDIRRVARMLNQRPRKTLGYKTPSEMFKTERAKISAT